MGLRCRRNQSAMATMAGRRGGTPGPRTCLALYYSRKMVLMDCHAEERQRRSISPTIADGF